MRNSTALTAIIPTAAAALIMRAAAMSTTEVTTAIIRLIQPDTACVARVTWVFTRSWISPDPARALTCQGAAA